MREGFQSLFSEGGLGLGKKLKEMENNKPVKSLNPIQVIICLN